MADPKQGMDPMLRKVVGGAMNPQLTDPMSGLGSVMGPSYGMGAVPNEQGAAMPPPQAAPIAEPSQAGIAEVVTAPRERKMGFLGKLLDGVGAMYGQEPKFRQAHQQRQMIDAMEGFADDPIGAIRRIGKLDPKAAWALLNQHQDNERQSGVAARQLAVADAQINKYHQGIITSMYGAANEGNWAKMGPIIRKYAEDNKVQLPFEITDTFDPTATNAIFTSGIKPDQQVDNVRADETLNVRTRQGDARIQQGDARIQQGAQRLEDNRDYRETRIGQIDRGLDERERNNRVNNNKPTKQNPQARNVEVKDSQGKSRVVTISADGQRGVSTVGGKEVHYKIVNGKMHVVKVIAPK